MNKSTFKIIFVLIFCISVGNVLNCQVPQGFNYMAIAKDSHDEVIRDTELKIRIAILSSLTPVTIVWEEEHRKTTNSSGLFQLIVGDLEAQYVGGSAPSFSAINWSTQPLYIRTLIDFHGWLDMGSAQLVSVPYSLMTGDINGSLKKLSVAGNTTNMEEALFEVKNNLNQTVFAVYNEGVRVSVGDGLAKGATKGGFAIGGFDVAKAPGQEYLRVTPDSTRVYVKNTTSKGATKGGFAIGGFDAAKGSTGNFLDITPKNYFIGHETGTKRTTGLYNSVIGYKAGRNLTTGNSNTIIGYLADSSLTSGKNNIILGEGAGFKLSTGNHNTLIGSGAGYSHTDQEYNVMIGTAAGSNINAGGWNGSFNTFMGINAGYKIRNSKENVFLGTNAGYFLENGWSNTIVGIDAGRGGADNPYNYLGYWTERNTFLGCQAGRNLLNGNNNVFIGYQAGYGETGVSDKLYISNSSSNTIIYGDFLTGNIGLGTTTLTKKLNVTGEVGVSGNISAGSITAPVTGNLTGNVSGNVSGNVTGDVNGLTMGKVFLTGTGTLNIVTIAGGTFALNWEVSGNWIEIINTNPTLQCNYWYLRQDGLTTTTGNSLLVNPLANKKIITPINTENTGFEIHFGQADGTAGWCSVWLQYYNGALVGHYIKY